jgi:uncharacterized membrane protein YkvA (DUF1232 family)
MFTIWRFWRRFGGWRGTLAQGMLAWRLFKDARVPVLPKLIFPLVLVYFFSPINLLFEWIPLLGQVDDVGVALLAIGAFLKACPPHLVQEQAARLEAELAASEHLKRFGAAGRIVRPSFERWTGPADAAARVERPKDGKAA